MPSQGTTRLCLRLMSIPGMQTEPADQAHSGNARIQDSYSREGCPAELTGVRLYPTHHHRCLAEFSLPSCSSACLRQHRVSSAIRGSLETPECAQVCQVGFQSSKEWPPEKSRVGYFPSAPLCDVNVIYMTWHLYSCACISMQRQI